MTLQTVVLVGMPVPRMPCALMEPVPVQIGTRSNAMEPVSLDLAPRPAQLDRRVATMSASILKRTPAIVAPAATLVAAVKAVAMGPVKAPARVARLSVADNV